MADEAHRRRRVGILSGILSTLAEAIGRMITYNLIDSTGFSHIGELESLVIRLFPLCICCCSCLGENEGTRYLCLAFLSPICRDLSG